MVDQNLIELSFSCRGVIGHRSLSIFRFPNIVASTSLPLALSPCCIINKYNTECDDAVDDLCSTSFALDAAGKFMMDGWWWVVAAAASGGGALALLPTSFNKKKLR
jgi:hypothetical protein